MDMISEQLAKKIQRLLKTDAGLSFLLGLKRKDLETRVASIRGRLDQAWRWQVGQVLEASHAHCNHGIILT
jgi:hypothetical protein